MTYEIQSYKKEIKISSDQLESGVELFLRSDAIRCYPKSISSNELKITDGLTTKEFSCRCRMVTCHFTLVHPKLIEAYSETRKEFGRYLIIRSGFRCQTHNIDVEGAAESYHTMGMAIDIAPTNPRVEVLNDLEIIAKKHFSKVLRYRDFIHCDVR